MHANFVFAGGRWRSGLPLQRTSRIVALIFEIFNFSYCCVGCIDTFMHFDDLIYSNHIRAHTYSTCTNYKSKSNNRWPQSQVLKCKFGSAGKISHHIWCGIKLLCFETQHDVCSFKFRWWLRYLWKFWPKCIAVYGICAFILHPNTVGCALENVQICKMRNASGL